MTGKTGQSAGDVGDRLHDSAKSFGEALLGGIKYAGRTVINFFNDDKSRAAAPSGAARPEARERGDVACVHGTRLRLRCSE